MSKRVSSSAVRKGGAGKKKKKGMPRIPEKVLDDAEAAGAVRERCPGEDLCILRMSFEDDAYNIVNNWISQMDGDPGVLAIFAPSANIIGTTIVPANGLQIQNEASSIVNHYAPFTAANFNGIPSPAIPGTIPAPQMPINVQHRSAHAPSAHSKSASSKLPSLVGFAIWVVHLQCSYSVGKCGSNNGSL